MRARVRRSAPRSLAADIFPPHYCRQTARDTPRHVSRRDCWDICMCAPAEMAWPVRGRQPASQPARAVLASVRKRGQNTPRQAVPWGFGEIDGRGEGRRKGFAIGRRVPVCLLARLAEAWPSAPRPAKVAPLSPTHLSSGVPINPEFVRCASCTDCIVRKRARARARGLDPPTEKKRQASKMLVARS